MYNEEVELDGRDPEQDYQQYKESCESLATLMSEIQELKSNGAKEGVRVVLCYYRLISVSVIVKSHNRRVLMKTRFCLFTVLINSDSSFQCAEVEQKRVQSCIHFMNLKKLNRLAHMRLKRGRDQTHDVSPT